MDMFLKCGGRGLFYIGTNEGVVQVYNWICTNYPQLLGMVGVYTSLLPNEQRISNLLHVSSHCQEVKSFLI